MQNIGDTFGQVFRAIGANKVRSFLTMFGIAWGVGSMLLLISVGEGFRSGQHRQLASIGNDVIMMWGGTIPAVPSQHTGMRPYYLTVDDEAAMRASGSFRQVMAMVRRSDLKQQSQYESAGGSVIGTEPNYPAVRTLPMAAGRFLDDGDLQNRSRVLVLGSEERSAALSGPAGSRRICLAQRHKLPGGRRCGQNRARQRRRHQPANLHSPHHHAGDVSYKGRKSPPECVELDSIPASGSRREWKSAKAAARAIIASRHGFSPDNPDAFEEWDTIKSDELVGKIFTAMDVFLGGVGIVTLALGAVGIVNIMLVSVSGANARDPDCVRQSGRRSAAS